MRKTLQIATILIAVLCSHAFLSIHYAHAVEWVDWVKYEENPPYIPVTMYESFDDGFFGDWVLNFPDKMGNATDFYVSAPFSLKIADDNTSGFNAYHEFYTQTGDDLRLQLQVRLAQTDCEMGIKLFSGSPTAGSTGVMVAFRDNGYLSYYDSSYHDLVTYSPNTWYNLTIADIDLSTDTYDIWLDESQKKDGASFRNAQAQLVNFTFGSASTATGTAWLDDIRIDEGTSEWTMIGSPSIVEYSNAYYMYHSQKFGHMSVLTSPDMMNWSQYSTWVIEPSFGWIKMCNPTVLHNGSHFLMWYESYYDSFNVSISFAYSTNGFDWSLREEPVLEKTGSGWEARLVATPAVDYYDGYYYMCYEGLTSAGLAQLGMARSSDGIAWTRGDHNPTIPVGGAGTWDSVQTNNPSIKWDADAGKWIVFYAGKSGAGLYSIGLTTSFYWDREYQKHPSNPLIEKGIGWESERVLNPARPLIYNATHHIMYYTGYDGSTYQTGCAFNQYSEGAPPPPPPPEDETTAWFTENIMLIIGVVGLFLFVLAPTLTISMLKDGDERAIGYGAMCFVLGLCFVIAWLYS